MGPIYRSASIQGKDTHRHMLELAILGLLKERSMHGYQLSRELGDSLGGFWRVSYGSLYPTLRRLEAEGAIESAAGPQERGRRKNTYSITEKGEKLFFELLQETPHDNSTEDTRFRVRLAFFRYLPPETRIRLLERRRATLEDRLSTIKDSLHTTRERVDTYTLALMEHGRNATESDIVWLDGLIAAERMNGAPKPRKTTTNRGGTKRVREPRALRRKEHTS
jgi:DNA-binding PadR family transcriptional regulator